MCICMIRRAMRPAMKPRMIYQMMCNIGSVGRRVCDLERQRLRMPDHVLASHTSVDSFTGPSDIDRIQQLRQYSCERNEIAFAYSRSSRLGRSAGAGSKGWLTYDVSAWVTYSKDRRFTPCEIGQNVEWLQILLPSLTTSRFKTPRIWTKFVLFLRTYFPIRCCLSALRTVLREWSLNRAICWTLRTKISAQ